MSSDQTNTRRPRRRLRLTAEQRELLRRISQMDQAVEQHNRVLERLQAARERIAQQQMDILRCRFGLEASLAEAQRQLRDAGAVDADGGASCDDA